MRYKISDKIIRSTKCDSDYECLDGASSHCKCSIDHHVYGSSIFLVTNDKLNLKCPHISMMSDSYVCTCPVKIELYKKYRI